METVLQEVLVLRRLVGREEAGYLHPHELPRLQLVCRSMRIYLNCYRDPSPVELLCYWTAAVPSPLSTFTLVNGLLLPGDEVDYRDTSSNFNLYLKYDPLRHWGLYTASFIPEDSHIIRYFGEVIRTQELHRRTMIYGLNVDYP